jgi:hypothetical protein
MRETNEKSILFKAVTMPDSDKKISYMSTYLLKIGAKNNKIVELFHREIERLQELGYKDLALRYLENKKSGE